MWGKVVLNWFRFCFKAVFTQNICFHGKENVIVKKRKGLSALFIVLLSLVLCLSVLGDTLEAATTYKVTFKNWNGTTLKTQTVSSGGSATAPSAPSRTGYSFSGWDKSFTNVKSNLTVTALFRQNVTQYTVTFKNWNGTTLKTQTVSSEIGRAHV